MAEQDGGRCEDKAVVEKADEKANLMWLFVGTMLLCKDLGFREVRILPQAGKYIHFVVINVKYAVCRSMLYIS